MLFFSSCFHRLIHKRLTISSNIFISFSLLILILILIPQNVSGAFEDLPVGCRAIGLGSAFVAIAEGPESIPINPAGIAQNPNFTLSLFFSRPYGIKEMTYETLSLSTSIPFGCFGFNCLTYGHDLYRENIMSLAWALNVQNRWYYGVSIRIAHLQIKKYGSEILWLVDLGCITQLTERLSCGLSLSNINQGRIGKIEEPLPQITRFGLSFQLHTTLMLSVECDKDIGFPPEIKGGIEFKPINTIHFRCGFGQNPDQFSVGLGFIINKIYINYALRLHSVLPSTHQGSIQFIIM